ncbi:hypothetical protein UlMin_040434 [Ulmus minor]
MGKGEREQLFQTLNSHLNTIHETFQVLDQSPASSLEKVKWEDVVKMGEQVSKQATIVGMLWTGESPRAKELKENMETYFNMLQGFLLLSHGSTVGAGPTLSSSVHATVKQVVDCSFKLLKESVSLFEANKDQKLGIPQLVGAVWEACTALNKTPGSNVTAIGRAMTQVAVSIKDVLREMKELKPDSCMKDESELQDDGSNLSEDDLGNDLSPEEMKVVQMAITVVSETLVMVKELIRSITGLLKLEKPNDTSDFVDSLEKLLKQCQGIGTQIDELGACLYPPQEVPVMQEALQKISSIMDDMQKELETLKGNSEAFLQACNGLKDSMRQLKSELDCADPSDLGMKVQNVVVLND